MTLFYYDGIHIIEETDSSQALTRLSLFGIRIDEVLYSGDLDGGGDLENHRWPMADHLGSVHLVVNDGGTVTSRFDYTTAYGEADLDGEAYPYGFTGRRVVGSGGELYDYSSLSACYRVDFSEFANDESGLVVADGNPK